VKELKESYLKNHRFAVVKKYFQNIDKNVPTQRQWLKGVTQAMLSGANVIRIYGRKSIAKNRYL
jgi:hypothetical protein